MYVSWSENGPLFGPENTTFFVFSSVFTCFRVFCRKVKFTEVLTWLEVSKTRGKPSFRCFDKRLKDTF